MINSRALNNEIQSYICDTFVESDLLLENIRSSFNDNSKHSMQISPNEGKLLQIIIKMNNVQKILEIGTFVGYSTIFMAKALGCNGSIYTIEKDKEHAKMAQEHFKEFKNIHLFTGNAIDIIPNLEPYKYFDMIFIDAQKSLYLDYLLLSEKLLKKGGIVVADNTLLFNTIYNQSFSYKESWKNMRKFNEYIARSDLYDSILLPTPEGMSIGIKK